jgi:hypothetical protein
MWTPFSTFWIQAIASLIRKKEIVFLSITEINKLMFTCVEQKICSIRDQTPFLYSNQYKKLYLYLMKAHQSMSLEWSAFLFILWRLCYRQTLFFVSLNSWASAIFSQFANQQTISFNITYKWTQTFKWSIFEKKSIYSLSFRINSKTLNNAFYIYRKIIHFLNLKNWLIKMLSIIKIIITLMLSLKLLCAP